VAALKDMDDVGRAVGGANWPPCICKILARANASKSFKDATDDRAPVDETADAVVVGDRESAEEALLKRA
jgi:hypothetical protein